jgi:aryl-alcohol dehydrogenase-like predicted oxidoreductase
MKYNKLGKTDLLVSECCLGTMTYGEQNTEAEGHQQMDFAFENGVNFFDTAELYSIPPKPETYGATERIIGTWLKEKNNRNDVIIASKIVGRTNAKWYRQGGENPRLTPAQIDYAIEQSLKRLNTNYIDLYQIHWPDRLIDNFGANIYRPMADDYIEFEIQLEAFEKHIKKGNIRHIGLSNETAWGMMKFLEASNNKNLPRIVSIQNAFNLLNRQFEPYLAEMAIREKVGLLAYSPLAQGYLTGKYMNGARPIGARTTLFNRGQRYETQPAEDMIAKYVNLAAQFNISPVTLALKFVASRDFVTSTIIGATNMEQLKTAIKAFDFEWNRSLEIEVNELHNSCPNPCP